MFFRPQEVVELRAIGLNGNSSFWKGFSKGIVSGYFNDAEALEKAAHTLDSAGASGVYFTLNPVNAALLARAVNRLIAPKNTTQDSDIACIRWFPLDLDPIRPAGISATEEEVKEAVSLGEKIGLWLESDFCFARGIRAYSGNGMHLLYRLPDLPNNQETHEIIDNALESVIAKFKNDKVDIDSKVTNPSRIWKFYGTSSRKGDSTPERPHRKSHINV
ncbi:hypothetical protein ASZ90_008404 [hydrocarbon metagenome]|uniref:Uncharacterized protein n=1 Tax=hydrocarbon metagenome TaxID=938273 RepID=A0A0W8FLS7_9ZZZZ